MGWQDDQVVSSGGGWKDDEVVAPVPSGPTVGIVSVDGQDVSMSGPPASPAPFKAGPMSRGGTSSVTGKDMASTAPRGIDNFTSEDFVRPTLELGGMAAGSLVGSGVGPAGTVAGGGLGYAAGKETANLLYGKEQGTLPEELAQTGRDVVSGAAMEASGQVLGKAIPWVLGKGGEALKAVHGRLTGLGKSATEEAIAAGEKMGGNPFKNYSDFDLALRGKITGEEVVTNAQNSLQALKDARGAAYTAQLDKIKLDPTVQKGVVDRVSDKVYDLIGKNKFDIKPIQTESGIDFDFSKSTLVESQPVVKKALTDMFEWDDFTATGLDTLKKRISTYAGQVKKGTPPEAFLTRIEKTLSAELKDAIPGYSSMTKGYAEATKLIKDVESGLMMRKQGMSGRIVADQTLRRLLSSMKDNFSLRKDLVAALSAQGEDVSGQIAGYGMRSIAPVGLSGTGPAIVGNVALAQYVSPAFWPVLASSSPRVSAEFLRVFGKTLSQVRGTGKVLGEITAYSNKEEDNQ